LQNHDCYHQWERDLRKFRMLKIGANKIADWIFINFKSFTVELLNVVVDEAIKNLDNSLNEMDRSDIVEEISPIVRGIINKYIKECVVRNIDPLIRWSTIDDRRLIGRTFVPTNADIITVKNINKLKLYEKIMTDLLTLDPVNEFEILCCILMSNDGIRDIKRTRPPDHRIDFFGVYPGSGVPGSTFDFALKIIGQAKRYEKRVSEPDVDTLVSAIKHLENRKPRLREILPDEFVDLECSVGGYFIVSGEFTGTAWELIRNQEEKLMGRDAFYISYFLYANKIGIIENGDDINFNIEELKKYIEERKAEFPVFIKEV